jgi:hypothetical protein
MRKPSLATKLSLPALFLLTLCLLVIVPDLATATDGTHGLGQTGGVSGLSRLSGDIPTIVGNIIGTLLGLVGILFLVLVIYAGFLWMTAGGNDETVTKAKSLLRNAIIGIIIVFSAYAITTFFVISLMPDTDPTPESDTIPTVDPLEETMKGLPSEDEFEFYSDLDQRVPSGSDLRDNPF